MRSALACRAGSAVHRRAVGRPNHDSRPVPPLNQAPGSVFPDRLSPSPPNQGPRVTRTREGAAHSCQTKLANHPDFSLFWPGKSPYPMNLLKTSFYVAITLLGCSRAQAEPVPVQASVVAFYETGNNDYRVTGIGEAIAPLRCYSYRSGDNCGESGIVAAEDSRSSSYSFSATGHASVTAPTAFTTAYATLDGDRVTDYEFTEPTFYSAAISFPDQVGNFSYFIVELKKTSGSDEDVIFIYDRRSNGLSGRGDLSGRLDPGTYRLRVNSSWSVGAHFFNDPTVTRTASGSFNFEIGFGATDVKADSIKWNDIMGGVDFSYSSVGDPLSSPTTSELYWSRGPSFSDVISSEPIFSHEIPAGFNGTRTVHVPGIHLVDAPTDATHLVVTVNPNGSTSEAGQANNSTALPDTFVGLGFNVASNAISNQTIYILKELYRQAGQSHGLITSTARSPRRQAEIMFSQMLRGKISSYREPGERVKLIYSNLTTGLTRSEILEAKENIIQSMLDQIMAEGPGNVSRHCADFARLNVIDLSRNRFTTPSSRMRFVEAACRDTRISKLLGPTSYRCMQSFDPTYHIEIPQVSNSPSDLQSDDKPDGGLHAAPRSINYRLKYMGGYVDTGRVEFNFCAAKGDTFGAFVIPFSLPDLEQSDTMLFLLDSSGRLIASNDDGEDRGLDASLNAEVIPHSGTYTLVVTTYPNSPQVGNDGMVLSWPGNGEGSVWFEIEHSLTPALPDLIMHRLNDGRLMLEWEGNQTLQESGDLKSKWVDQPLGISPYEFDPSDSPQKFFRLSGP